jgi:hypothetical protein
MYRMVTDTLARKIARAAFLCAQGGNVFRPRSLNVKAVSITERPDGRGSDTE